MAGNIATDIQYMARLLTKYKLCKDPSPLTTAFSRVKNNDSYKVMRLKLNTRDIPRNTKPAVDAIDILLDVSMPSLEPHSFNLPFEGYSLSIEFSGLKETGDIVRSSWHLDYDNSNNSEYIHPYFHLTYGGKLMNNTELGNVLLLPAPRISYPPMDIILGIDFILSNFIKVDIYNEIKAESQYRSAVRRSQEKLWRPYVLSLAHHWCKFDNCVYSQIKLEQSKHLHPNLID